MEDKQLDNIVNDKLNKLEFRFEEADWDAFEAKLDGVERDFDAIVRSKLEDTPPYSHPSWHWTLMAERLEEQAAIRRRFISIKLMELCLLLLLFTGLNFYFRSNSFNTNTDIQAYELNVPPLIDEFDQNFDGEGKNNIPPTSNGAAEEEPIEEVPAQAIQDKQQKATTAPAISSLPVSEISSPAVHLELASPAVEDKVEAYVPLEETPIVGLEAPVSDLILPSDASESHRIVVSMFGISNIGRISTPYDIVLELAPYERWELGYGGGFAVSWVSHNFSVSTGVIYNHKEYSPALAPIFFGNSTTGYSVEGLEDIELNALQIPVEFSYKFVQQRKWDFYATAGVSINIVTQANYDVASATASELFLNLATGSNNSRGAVLTPSQIRRFQQYARPSAPQSEKLREKKFDDGWFHGGQFGDNSFYTINVGLGIERKLDHRTSLFFQPTYKQHLNILSSGIGPNRDRISNLELQLGIKVGL